jgi:hypothetical protein
MDRLCLFGANIDVYRTNGTNCIGHWVYGSGFHSETFFHDALEKWSCKPTHTMLFRRPWVI